MRVQGAHPAHAGSNPVIFAEAVDRMVFDKKNSVFLDFGSGKGRALLLASRHGFRKAIGVEISPALCAIARKNIAIYGKRHPRACIEVHCADAASFEIPIEVDIGFLYNPFGPEIIRSLIDRITESVARCPRDFYVVYLHPHFGDVFVNAGFRNVEQEANWLMLLRRGQSCARSGAV